MKENMTIREANEKKKWEAEKLSLCKSKKSFICVKPSENESELTLKVSEICGNSTLNSCKETAIMIAHPDMKMFPYRANLRFSTVTNEVHEMWKQMIVDPTYFAERNMGVTVYCDSADFFEKEGEKFVHLHFGEYGGATNGSHTTAAVVEGQLMGIASPNGFVKVAIREYIREVTPEEVATTCTALNSMKKQDDYGNGEVSGYHEAIKQSLGELVSCVEFKPNEKIYSEDETIHWDAVDTVCTMTVMAPNADGKHSNRRTTGTSKNEPYKKYQDAKRQGKTHSCEKILPILPECLMLGDHIIATLKDIPHKYTNNFVFKSSNKLSPITKVPVEVELSRLIYYPLMGAMSENIKFNKNTGEIEFFVDDFIGLYDVVRNKLWTRLNTYQKEQGAGGKYLFCAKPAESLWELMRSEVKMAIHTWNK